jgi:hypothetical protein
MSHVSHRTEEQKRNALIDLLCKFALGMSRAVRLMAIGGVVFGFATPNIFAVDVTFNINLIAESDPIPPGSNGFTYADVWSENGYAYVGSDRGGYGMSVFSISNSGIPTFQPGPDWDPGDPFTPTYAGSEMEDVEVWDGIGYFASDVNGAVGRTGVDIVDLSIPFEPLILSRVDTSDCLAGNPSVCAHGKVHTISIQRVNPGTPSEQRFMYTSDNSTTVVKITDVTNPLSPQLVTSLSLPGLGSSVDSHEVVVRNNRLYIASKNPNETGGNPEDDDGWFHIYDVATPANPVLLKAFESGISNHTAMPTDDGNTLIVAEERPNGNVKIYDISMIDQPNDPQNPVLLATLNQSNVCHNGDCISAHSPHHIHVHGNLLFLPWYEAGLQVFNIVDPANPVYVGAFDTFPGDWTANFSGNWGVDLSQGLDRVLLSDRQRGLIVVNATGVVDRGDFNTDLLVDDADYTAWTTAFGTSTSGQHNGPLADGNYDEVVDAADYVIWRKFSGGSEAGNFSGRSSNAPEPASLLLLAVGGGLMMARRRAGR